MARPCEVCGREANGPVCPACAASAPFAETSVDLSSVHRKLLQITSDLTLLADDPDVARMPADLRQRLLQVFGETDPAALLREEYRHQIDAWRAKGFAVDDLEHLLATDLPRFRERGAQAIREQIRTSAGGADRRCPLCDEPLLPDVGDCDNCGARLD